MDDQTTLHYLLFKIIKYTEKQSTLG